MRIFAPNIWFYCASQDKKVEVLKGRIGLSSNNLFLEIPNKVKINLTTALLMDFQAFGNMGWICLKEGRLADARTYLETALRLNPDDSVAQQNLTRLNGLKQ